MNLAFYLSFYIPNLKNRSLLMSCEHATWLSEVSPCSFLLLTAGLLLLGGEKRGFLIKHRAHLPRGCVPQHQHTVTAKMCCKGNSPHTPEGRRAPGTHPTPSRQRDDPPHRQGPHRGWGCSVEGGSHFLTCETHTISKLPETLSLAQEGQPNLIKMEPFKRSPRQDGIGMADV